MAQHDDDILDVAGAAAFLNVGVSTVYVDAARGRLPARKAGRRWVFSRAALEEWLGRQQAPMTIRLAQSDVDRIANEVIRRLGAVFGAGGEK